jgi:myo-inositol-1(or 4)-monophosphatase
MITSAKPTTTSSAGTKKNSTDLVTETDRAVEAYISNELGRMYPDFSFMGEETYVPGQTLGDEPTFVVDPIDGTTNFVHRFPYVSVSLGFAVKKIPTVGVVYNPFTGRLYSGVRGRGSFVFDINQPDQPDEDEHNEERQTGDDQVQVPKEEQGTKLPVKELAALGGLDECVVAIEFGSDRTGQNWKTKTDTWARLGRRKEDGGAMVHSARALGSAALNLCGVAEGVLDVYWEGGCWAWDVCAGWVILTEAGGLVVDGNPSGRWDIPVDHRKYLAVKGAKDGQGQKELVEEFWGYIEGEMVYEH